MHLICASIGTIYLLCFCTIFIAQRCRRWVRLCRESPETQVADEEQVQRQIEATIRAHDNDDPDCIVDQSARKSFLQVCQVELVDLADESGRKSVGADSKTNQAIDQATCAICLNQMVASEEADKRALARLPNCGHMFHAACLDAWKTYSCPLCRKDAAEV